MPRLFDHELVASVFFLFPHGSRSGLGAERVAEGAAMDGGQAALRLRDDGGGELGLRVPADLAPEPRRPGRVLHHHPQRLAPELRRDGLQLRQHIAFIASAGSRGTTPPQVRLATYQRQPGSGRRGMACPGTQQLGDLAASAAARTARSTAAQRWAPFLLDGILGYSKLQFFFLVNGAWLDANRCCVPVCIYSCTERN